jgi:hypothetical protein
MEAPKENQIAAGEGRALYPYNDGSLKRSRGKENMEQYLASVTSHANGGAAAPIDVHLVVVLDESGSMDNQTQAVVDGLNEMLRGQRKIEGKVIFSLVTFSNHVQTKVDRVDLAEMPDLTLLDYHPCGGTALYDGIGNTITKFKDQFGVIMVIATDGCENSSRMFNADQVKMMISHCEQKLDWKFMYICEDLTSFNQGQGLGLGSRDSRDVHRTGGRGTMGSHFAAPSYHASLSRNRNLSAYSPSNPSRGQDNDPSSNH